MALTGIRPDWLTFDCYGTLIQWDEGLIAALTTILSRKGAKIDLDRFMAAYDRREHALEEARPHRSFREITALSLTGTMRELGLAPDEGDAEILTGSISAMPPFPEIVATLGRLKQAGFRLAIVSNTDDAVIAGNVRQLGGHIDRVITAEQAQAYKPSRVIFEHAWKTLGIKRETVVHICASPVLDLTASRDLGFRAVWIDRGTGRKAPAGYTPDAVLPTLAGVPGLLVEAGWM